MQHWMKDHELAIENNKRHCHRLSKEEQRKSVKIQHRYWNTSRSWKKVYHALKQSYLATTSSFVKAIRYDTQKREFYTLVEWQDNVNESLPTTRTATLPVSDEAWVRDMFQNDFVDYVKNCAQHSKGDKF